MAVLAMPVQTEHGGVVMENPPGGGKNVIREAFWVSLFPGLALTIAGLSLNLLGDGLRDVLDPRLRVR